MRKRFMAAAGALVLAMLAVASAERLKVQVNEAVVRQKPTPLSKKIMVLQLGDEIEAAADPASANWYVVTQTPGGPTKGYLAKSAVTSSAPLQGPTRPYTRGASDPQVTAAVKGWGETHQGLAKSGKARYDEVDYVGKTGRARESDLTQPGGYFENFRRQGALGEFSRWGGANR